MKNLKKIAAILAIVSLVLNTIETIYFGCNLTPMSRAEEQWDTICALLIGLAICFVIAGHFIEEK